MADDPKLTQAAIEADKERTLTRCIATVVTIAIVTVFGSITWGCSQSYHNDAQAAAQKAIADGRNSAAELQQKIECVKAGGSWMPVQGINTQLYTNSANVDYRTYEMSCVSQSALQAVIAQNAKIIESMPKDK